MIVGYTSGVFDLFHVGHLNILRRARAECDFLIAAVTTDELSLSRKGKTPVIPYSERVEIVQSIRHVDKVVPQSDMDKYGAWEEHRFDRMFVGDDWRGHPSWVALEERFRLVSVDIVYFPYTQHTSSTILRDVLNRISRDQSAGQDGA
jgi:glycerol-3-phosphate cytidylyltransferase